MLCLRIVCRIDNKKRSIMKKVLLIFVFAVMAICPAVAQDTVVMRDLRMKQNYLVMDWPDTFMVDYFEKTELGWLELYGRWARDQAKQEAWWMYTDDTLQVYGIAVGMTSSLHFRPEDTALALAHGIDTSHANSYEFWRLYEAETDSLRQISEDLLFHLNSSVSYYLDLDLYNGAYSSNKLRLIPIYERFFSAPIPVTDSFYVGRRYGPQPNSRSVDVLLPELTNLIPPYPVIKRAIYFDYVQTFGGVPLDTIRGWYYLSDSLYTKYLFIFPIIAPPDTTTVGVEKPDMVYRYTSVQPNPATERVEVLSSFGVRRVEVYSMSGAKVMDVKAQGFKATFDVSKLPSSTYLLRIHTPQGMTTKKLVVR